MDNFLPKSLNTPKDLRLQLASRFKARRLALNLTQQGLAARAGVSWSSLKRFEYKGLIALDALLNLALVLNCLGDFDSICANANQDLAAVSLDDLLKAPNTRRKGRIK